jgi:hypothetical protein
VNKFTTDSDEMTKRILVQRTSVGDSNSANNGPGTNHWPTPDLDDEVEGVVAVLEEQASSKTVSSSQREQRITRPTPDVNKVFIIFSNERKKNYIGIPHFPTPHST